MLKFWDGKEWEDHIGDLLVLRYGLDYQRVPAEDKGDLGIDGFARTAGHAFQCYAPTEPIARSDRLKAQKRKMTQDVGKFIRNKNALATLFNTVKISRWVMVVPNFESKDLLLHASKKTSDVIAANLPYVASDFQVAVAAEKDFAQESAMKLSAGAIKLVTTPPEDEDLDSWTSTADVGLLNNLDRKGVKLTGWDPPMRQELLRKYVEGDLLLAELRRRNPLVHAEITKYKRRKDGDLKLLSLSTASNGAALVVHARTIYTEGLRATLPALSASDAETLGWQAVVDWLMICRLEP